LKEQHDIQKIIKIIVGALSEYYQKGAAEDAKKSSPPIKCRKKYGVYAILCKGSNRIYIGKGNLYNRYSNHWSNAKTQKHICKELQNDWNKYGQESFEFIPIFQTDNPNDEEINHLESQLIDLTHATDPRFGYNKNKGPEKFTFPNLVLTFKPID
jgi:hypothetical protein